MAISMLKIRRPLGRLIFNMGIAIPGKTVFLIETAPWLPLVTKLCKSPHGPRQGPNRRWNIHIHSNGINSDSATSVCLCGSFINDMDTFIKIFYNQTVDYIAYAQYFMKRVIQHWVENMIIMMDPIFNDTKMLHANYMLMKRFFDKATYG